MRVAKIEQLLKVSLPEGALVEGPDGELVVADAPTVLRLAVCKVFKLQPMQAELWVAKEAESEPQLQAIDCRRIASSLACAQPGRGSAAAAGVPGGAKLFFMRFNTVSRS